MANAAGNPITPEEAAAAGYTLNDQGFYQDAGGNLAPGQTTAGAAANPQGKILYDKEKDLNYTIVGGKKQYQSPVAYTNDANPKTIYKTSNSGQPISDTGGGMVHGAPHWNAEKGKWDVGLDMGKILSIAAAGGIAAPFIIPALAAAGGGSAAAGGVLPATTTVGSSTLGGGIGGLISGGAGLGAGGTAGVLGGAAIPAGSALAASAGVPLAAGTTGTSALTAAQKIAGIGKALTAAGGNAAAAQNTQNEATNAYQRNLLDLYGKNLTQQEQNNTIATKNPSTFAKQSALAGILGNTPTFTEHGGSALNYRGPGDEAKAAMTELQKQAINNLIASPEKNPVPSAGSVVAPTLTAPTGSKVAGGLGLIGSALDIAPSIYSLFK